MVETKPLNVVSALGQETRDRIVDETRTVRRLLLEAVRKVIHVMWQEKVLDNYCLK